MAHSVAGSVCSCTESCDSDRQGQCRKPGGGSLLGAGGGSLQDPMQEAANSSIVMGISVLLQMQHDYIQHAGSGQILVQSVNPTSCPAIRYSFGGGGGLRLEG